MFALISLSEKKSPRSVNAEIWGWYKLWRVNVLLFKTKNSSYFLFKKGVIFLRGLFPRTVIICSYIVFLINNDIRRYITRNNFLNIRYAPVHITNVISSLAK